MPDQPVAPPSARERIGGRWAVSVQVAVVAWVGIVATSLGALRNENIAPFTASGFDARSVVFQCLAVSGVLLLAHLTVLRRRVSRPVPIGVVVVVGVMAGSARLGVELAFSGGVPQQFSPLEAAIAGVAVVAVGGVMVPVVAYLLATREWYVLERDRLIRIDVATEVQRLRAAGALDALESLVVEAAQDDLDTVAAPARRALAREEADPARAAEALIQAARDGVRPAGQALAGVAAQSIYPRVSLWQVATTELNRHPLPISWPVLAAILVVIPRTLRIGGVPNAIVIPLVIAISVFACFRFGRVLIRRSRRLALPVTVVACVIAIIPVEAVQVLLFDADPRRPGFLALAFFLFLFVYVVSFVATAEDSSAEVLESLRRPLLDSDIERRALEQAREDLSLELGLHLHASVQSGLVAASYAIQDAIARGDDAAQIAALEAARDTLDQRIALHAIGAQTEHEEATVDLRASIDRDWDGIIAVHWEPSPPAAANRPEVLRLLHECLANALIHGRAGSAEVRISVGRDRLDIAIEDDGSGPDGGLPGLGSAVLDDATGGNWTIAPGTTGGSLVTAQVALA